MDALFVISSHYLISRPFWQYTFPYVPVSWLWLSPLCSRLKSRLLCLHPWSCHISEIKAVMTHRWVMGVKFTVIFDVRGVPHILLDCKSLDGRKYTKLKITTKQQQKIMTNTARFAAIQGTLGRGVKSWINHVCCICWTNIKITQAFNCILAIKH